MLNLLGVYPVAYFACIRRRLSLCDAVHPVLCKASLRALHSTGQGDEISGPVLVTLAASETPLAGHGNASLKGSLDSRFGVRLRYPEEQENGHGKALYSAGGYRALSCTVRRGSRSYFTSKSSALSGTVVSTFRPRRRV